MADFTAQIQGWYRQNKRDLPWREVNDAYKIWLSEVILQQTRVDQGTNYYVRFISNFPTVRELANAPEDQVLNLWQGLGYYSRARNLHYSAKQVLNDFGGVFPTNYSDLRALKGVGDYTAAAIASIAFGLPHAVVDGNVYRVLSRYLALDTPIDSVQGKKEFSSVASDLLDQNNPGDHNQALMELGALVCLPKNPRCGDCPLVESCMAHEIGNQLDFPVKSKKTKVSKRFLNYLVFSHNGKTLIKKRVGEGIWEGLYDFPCIEKMQNESLMLSEIEHYQPVSLVNDGSFKHILSHQNIQAQFWVVEVAKLKPESNEVIVEMNQIEDYPLPQLLIRYLNQSPLFGAD